MYLSPQAKHLTLLPVVLEIWKMKLRVKVTLELSLSLSRLADYLYKWPHTVYILFRSRILKHWIFTNTYIRTKPAVRRYDSRLASFLCRSFYVSNLAGQWL